MQLKFGLFHMKSTRIDKWFIGNMVSWKKLNWEVQIKFQLLYRSGQSWIFQPEHPHLRWSNQKWYVSLDRRRMSIPFLILFSTSLAGLLTRSSWFDMLMTSGSSFNPDDISALSFFLPSSPACKTWKILIPLFNNLANKKSSSKSLAFPYTQNPASTLVTPIYDPVHIKLTQ